MEKRGRNRHTIDIIFPLTFMLMFGFCALLVVMQGARIYEKTTAGLRENYTVRTAVTYLQEKVREHSDPARVSVVSTECGPMLRLEQSRGGKDYVTCIYQKDGSLRELFCLKDSGFSPDAGQELMPVDDFSVEKEEDDLLKATVSWNRQEETVFLRLYADAD